MSQARSESSSPLQIATPEVEAIVEWLLEAESRAVAEAPPRRPSATYRLQLHQGFSFADAAGIIGYLNELGITDIYLSPYLQARPGSTHGYDVIDHGRINPEIGDAAAHAALIAGLRERGMGRLLDVVPNHMGIGGKNAFWRDVLENGPQAPSDHFFDIDWQPVKEELEGRVLLPILEDQYGVVLETGKFVLGREGGEFSISYGDYQLPLAPRSYARILELRGDELRKRFDPEDDHVLEYQSIWAASEHLPRRGVTDRVLVERKLREKEVIKRRLRRLCEERPDLSAFIDENIVLFRGTPGDPKSFDRLHGLLEQQVYRLAYWRVAAEEINYRRFFDINDLAGLMTEDPQVFDMIHELIFQWVEEGGVTGLRVDHPDGLADPLGYFQRLQKVLFSRACRQRLEAERPDIAWSDIVEPLAIRYRAVMETDPKAPLALRLPIVAEKILSRGEELPADWPIDGTVGYEFLNAVNGLFVDPSASEAIEATYVEFTGDREPFVELLYTSKQLITRTALTSEVNMLARQLNRISERDRRSRDFTLNDLRRALREVIACFPVYRTYLQPGQTVSDRDRNYITQAIARARRRNPTIDATVFAFIQDALLLNLPEDVAPEDRTQREEFVVRFQQTTGPVQAKGLEDTAFYRQFKLAALNEVGADPTRFGNSPSVFHGLNAHRLNNWPGGLSTTATHDTKRGEDARIRIDAITELTDEWRTRLVRWSRWNARKKSEIQGSLAPDSREEYLLYQTLVGAWPFETSDEVSPPGFSERIQQYMNKALREAKLNTSWTDPDTTYVDAVRRFIAEILEGPDSGTFLKDFLPFQRRIARIGVIHSLSQTLLKLTSPGVPDVYQGCELWDLSLVDPDNRRPVDFTARAGILDQIQAELTGGTSRAALAARLLAAPEDGAIKLFLIWAVLNSRRDNLALFQQGAYRPLDVEGELAARLIAFARQREGRSSLTVVPRLVAGLMDNEAASPPIGRAVWGETRLILPDTGSTRWRNVLTDEIATAHESDGRAVLEVSDVFETVPLGLLIEQQDGT